MTKSRRHGWHKRAPNKFPVPCRWVFRGSKCRMAPLGIIPRIQSKVFSLYARWSPAEPSGHIPSAPIRADCFPSPTCPCHALLQASQASLNTSPLLAFPPTSRFRPSRRHSAGCAVTADGLRPVHTPPWPGMDGNGAPGAPPRSTGLDDELQLQPLAQPQRPASKVTGQSRKKGTACARCRSQKIRCDDQTPSCANCARVGHLCLRGNPTNNQETARYAFRIMMLLYRWAKLTSVVT